MLTQNSITDKLRSIDTTNQELAKLIEAAGGVESNPDELKVTEFERNIHDVEIKINEIQSFWMRLQGRVVTMTEKRANQLNDIFIARKRNKLLIKLTENLQIFTKP